MTKLSVVINTLNEEKNLPRALGSVKSLVDEIIVVDMSSDDRTREIAKKFSAKVFGYPRTNYVEPARNFAISKASGDWVLILDADEEISGGLVKKITETIKSPKADFFRIPRKNIIFGKWVKHSRWWPDYNIRLFKKGSVTWNEVIHSVPMTAGIGADFPEQEECALIHHHYESIGQYVERLNRYTSIQAKERIKEGYVFHWTDIVQKPASEFFSRYFAAEGYKDGLHGLALALLQSFSELVLILKVWEQEKFKEQNIGLPEISKSLNEFQSDLNYWKADSLLKQKHNPWQIIKRKFRLP